MESNNHSSILAFYSQRNNVPYFAAKKHPITQEDELVSGFLCALSSMHSEVLNEEMNYLAGPKYLFLKSETYYYDSKIINPHIFNSLKNSHNLKGMKLSLNENAISMSSSSGFLCELIREKDSWKLGEIYYGYGNDFDYYSKIMESIDFLKKEEETKSAFLEFEFNFYSIYGPSEESNNNESQGLQNVQKCKSDFKNKINSFFSFFGDEKFSMKIPKEKFNEFEKKLFNDYL